MEELRPGLFHWSTFHDGIGRRVHSSFVSGSGTLIDPMRPDGGLDAIAELGRPERIVLSNRHHFRHSGEFVERFDCQVLCHEAGLSHFEGRQQVDGFAFAEQLAGDVRSLELAAICAEETTLLLAVEGGALSFGDGLRRDEEGSLAFMPDSLLGDQPEQVKAGLHSNLLRMLDEEFDMLLFAHAEPVLTGGRSTLEQFLGRGETTSA